MDTAGDLFRRFSHASAEASDVTFNLKDLRTMVALCEAAGADLLIHMGTAGSPLLVEPTWAPGADKVGTVGHRGRASCACS